jgi:hypothetical protein
MRISTTKTLSMAAAFLVAGVAAAQKAPNCTHCGFPVPVEAMGSRLVTVKVGGKTYPVRCMLCARDLAAQYRGKAEIHAPTEDPKRPLILTSDDEGNWTSSLPSVVFLEVEGDHAFCAKWSRAFTSAGEFDRYVAENARYKDAKPLRLEEWSSREGKEMDHQAMPGMAHEEMGSMMGKLGPWSMAREGSGTSWLPDTSPMFMKSLPKQGRYELSLMGLATLNYTDAGGKRGDSQFFSNSMPMLMARRETGGGIVSLNLMASADPIINGKRGYPDLFQTGETANGRPLVDRQHPHDLLSELTLSYSRPLNANIRWFVYGGPVGEPALGGPMYLHRPSGMEIPEAPITHHWFDATHISWGVFTAGVNSDKWQLEGSVFNGHEPDENRYSPDPIQLNSAATRLTYNPNQNLSLNVSYGYLNSPESTEPGVDQHRITAAALYGRDLANGDHLALAGTFGRNIKHGGAGNAFVLEGTYFKGANSYFARFENVDKDELVGVPAGNYNVNKLLFGGVHNLTSRGGFDIGLGAYAGLYAFPSSLDPFYGKNAVTFGVFLRVRPSRMKHDMGMGGMEHGSK